MSIARILLFQLLRLFYVFIFCLALSACAPAINKIVPDRNLSKLQWQFSQEMRERRALIKDEAPISFGPFVYLLKQDPNLRHPRLWRATSSDPQKLELVLDPNLWLANYPQSILYNLKPSPDHSKIAWSVRLQTAKEPILFIHSVQAQLSAVLSKIHPYQMEWANNDELVFSSTEKLRPANIYSLLLAKLDQAPKRLLQEPRADHYLELSRSKDQSMLFVSSRAESDSSLYLRDCLKIGAEFSLLHKAQGVNFARVEHKNGKVYALALPAAQLLEFSLAKKNEMRAIFSSDALNWISNFDLFDNAFILEKQSAGLPWLEVYDSQLKLLRQFKVREDLTSFELALNPDYNSKLLKFRAINPLREPELISFDLNSLTLKTDSLYHLPALDFKSADWKAQRIFADSADGTQVPITLMSTASGAPAQKAKTVILSAYGAYGENPNFKFNPDRVSFLKRDIDYAIAHVRGGGENGPDWHRAGSQLNKLNSFTDYIACAEKLKSLGYINIVGYGRSAGALIQGYTLNSRPDLLRASIMEMPFLDPLGFGRDLSSPHRVREFSEWGNPEDPKVSELISHYSPLQNIKRQAYPPILMITSEQDELVPWTQARRFEHRLKNLRTNNAPLMLNVEYGSSHSSASFDYQQTNREALKLAFVLENVLKN